MLKKYSKGSKLIISFGKVELLNSVDIVDYFWILDFVQNKRLDLNSFFFFPKNLNTKYRQRVGSGTTRRTGECKYIVLGTPG